MNGTRDEPQWWEHPDRKCINDVRFTERARGRKGKEELAELIYLCLNCPVIKACHDDAAAASLGKYPTTDVVQGGRTWP